MGRNKASQPISRVLSRTIIHLRPVSPQVFSGLPEPNASSICGFLFGLAPSGVYLATNCYQSRGALLPHHFTLTSKPESSAAVYFAPDGSDDLIITLNGGTTGGLIGDTIELIGISAEEWRVRARLSTATASGSITTPFS